MAREPDWVARAPHPALRPFVARYLGYTGFPPAPGVHRGLPSAHATLIVSLDEPVPVVGMPDPAQLPVRARALLGGLSLAPVLIGRERPQSGVQVELRPLGLAHLFGVRAADLSGHVVDLADLADLADVGASAVPVPRSLPDRVAEAPDWARRFAALDAALSACLARRWDPAPEMARAWWRLTRTAGALRIEALAHEVGWSRRHLAARFRAEIGLTPKQVARILRFERATAMLRAGGGPDLAGVAVACGYSDQAHLSHEWRALAGCSVRTWMSEEFPFLQDTSAASGADSEA